MQVPFDCPKNLPSATYETVFRGASQGPPLSVDWPGESVREAGRYWRARDKLAATSR
jgi:hypothetical protein